MLIMIIVNRGLGRDAVFTGNFRFGPGRLHRGRWRRNECRAYQIKPYGTVTVRKKVLHPYCTGPTYIFRNLITNLGNSEGVGSAIKMGGSTDSINGLQYIQ